MRSQKKTFRGIRIMKANDDDSNKPMIWVDLFGNSISPPIDPKDKVKFANWLRKTANWIEKF